MSFSIIDRIEKEAKKKSLIHLMSTRIKILILIIHILFIVSLKKYSIISLTYYFYLPIAFLTISNISFKLLLKQFLIALPFIFFIGIFNPFLDKNSIKIFDFRVSAGWISFLVILLKSLNIFLLTLITLYSSGFNNIINAMKHFKVPNIFILQLIFLYRYLEIFIQKIQNIRKSYRLRTGKKHFSVNVMISILKNLIVFSLERSEKIYYAMRLKGFSIEKSFKSIDMITKYDLTVLIVVTLLNFIIKMYI